MCRPLLRGPSVCKVEFCHIIFTATFLFHLLDDPFSSCALKRKRELDQATLICSQMSPFNLRCRCPPACLTCQPRGGTKPNPLVGGSHPSATGAMTRCVCVLVRVCSVFLLLNRDQTGAVLWHFGENSFLFLANLSHQLWLRLNEI